MFDFLKRDPAREIAQGITVLLQRESTSDEHLRRLFWETHTSMVAQYPSSLRTMVDQAEQRLPDAVLETVDWIITEIGLAMERAQKAQASLPLSEWRSSPDLVRLLAFSEAVWYGAHLSLSSLEQQYSVYFNACERLGIHVAVAQNIRERAKALHAEGLSAAQISALVYGKPGEKVIEAMLREPS